MTKRRVEILQLLSEGYVSKEIADTLQVSVLVVYDNFKGIKRQLRVKTREQAVRRGIEKGLIRIDL